MGSKHSNMKTNQYSSSSSSKSKSMFSPSSSSSNDTSSSSSTIQNVKLITCDYKCLCRVAYSCQLKQFLISDCEDNSLKQIDFDGNFIKSINPNSILKCPWAIAISKSMNEIYVSDGQLGKIIVFDVKFKYLRDFGENKIDLVECIALDESELLLYAADYRNSLVTVWYSKTGKFKDEFKIKSPCDIAVQGEKIYVTSENLFKFVPQTRKISYLSGDNCIYVLDKHTYALLAKIKFTDWLAPNCLHFDTRTNQLHTIAFHIDEHLNVSKTRYLYLIDQDSYTCLSRTNLNVDKTSDMCIVEKKIMFVRGPFSPPIHMLEFE